ncbi:CDP-glucose 4,6-dehydratase [Lacisediminihabitans sp.]|jgi:CDP-glucose 4,6-dehydratase|uniref:CDP-glucose 4,6-dehydratase n=1 Tax=Lacisediminihabitans sp. TaxID=2787631 RepID=UPI002F91DA57
MHYLVTGHTGFKGAWLTLLLRSRGHTVSGLSLDPLEGSLFETARLAELVEDDRRVDIRDATATATAIREMAPDVVFHLAAQPLVRRSYADPRETFETNVMGTLNVLEAVSTTPSVVAQVIVTTDKVYRNVDQRAGYRESDPLGGDDPYSASKAMADILTQSWVKSFPGVATAVARAGNVIGGGDVSPDRLMPDLLNSYSHGEPASLRYPLAVRPWQHVLDCLNGYLVLSDALLAGTGAGEWNFGPGEESFVAVGEVADITARLWGDGATWSAPGGEYLHEANLLALDSAKAIENLGWSNRLVFPQSVEWTVDWYRAVADGLDTRAVTADQIRAFGELA